MRKKLEKRYGSRLIVTAVVERFSMPHRPSYKRDRTVLLRDIKVRRANKRIADHIWLSAGEWAKKLKAGDTIEFETEVVKYIKSRKDKFRAKQIDYTLATPVKKPHIRKRVRRNAT